MCVFPKKRSKRPKTIQIGWMAPVNGQNRPKKGPKPNICFTRSNGAYYSTLYERKKIPCGLWVVHSNKKNPLSSLMGALKKLTFLAIGGSKPVSAKKCTFLFIWQTTPAPDVASVTRELKLAPARRSNQVLAPVSVFERPNKNKFISMKQKSNLNHFKQLLFHTFPPSSWSI